MSLITVYVAYQFVESKEYNKGIMPNKSDKGLLIKRLKDIWYEGAGQGPLVLIASLDQELDSEWNLKIVEKYLEEHWADF